MIHNITLIIAAAEIDEVLISSINLYRQYFSKIAVAMDQRLAKKSQLENHGLNILSYTSTIETMTADLFLTSKKVETEWVLRLDADEVLTRDLAQLLIEKEHEILKSQLPLYSLARRWCLFQNGQLLSLPELPRLQFDYQSRLYRHTDLKVKNLLHGPGFELPEENLLISPKNCILHFDWFLKSFRERKRKLLFYDQLRPGYLRDHFHYYLWELDPHILFRLQTENDPHGNHIAQFYLGSKQTAISQFNQHQIAHQLQEAYFYEKELSKIDTELS